MIFYTIEHRSEAFDSLVDILEKNFNIHVYEDDIAAPERSFIVSDKPISDPNAVFQAFYEKEKK